MRNHTDQNIVTNLSILLTGFLFISFQGCSPAKSTNEADSLSTSPIGLIDAAVSSTSSKVADVPKYPFTGIQGPGNAPMGAKVLSVSNSYAGTFAVNGTVCTKSSAFIRITNVERYRALACIVPAGQGCGLAVGNGMYEPNYREFLNDSTIQMDGLSKSLAPGLYDVYSSTLPAAFLPNGVEKVGSFQVVESCEAAAQLNSKAAVSQAVAAAPQFPSVFNGANAVLVSNEQPDSNGYFWHPQINLCNKGQFFLGVNFNNKTFPLKICTALIGSTECQNIANFHEFTDSEWAHQVQVQVKTDASKIAVGDYEIFLAYEQKSIVKAAYFRMQNCQ